MQLRASLSGPSLLTVPDLARPRKGNHPVLRASVHRNSAFSTSCGLSRPIFAGIRNSLSDLCIQHCLKCSVNRWLEICWFPNTARVSRRSVAAFGEQMLGEPSRSVNNVNSAGRITGRVRALCGKQTLGEPSRSVNNGHIRSEYDKSSAMIPAIQFHQCWHNYRQNPSSVRQVYCHLRVNANLSTS